MNKNKKGKETGFLNFGAGLMKDRIRLMINGLNDKKLGIFRSLREPETTNQMDS